jgi:methylated-DNA-protein-cysteine methyltransferase-like protein
MSSDVLIEIIQSIPKGKVMGYGQIAAAAGLHNGARTVARLLHSSARKHNLPWWRVIRSSGEIALPDESGGSLQKELLLKEGVVFISNRVVDMKHCGIEYPKGDIND